MDDCKDYELKEKFDWSGKQVIGTGSFGYVSLEQIRRPGQSKYELCAVKRISRSNPRYPVEKYVKEVSNFARLGKLECFVRFYGWQQDARSIYIAMEYLELGDLRSHIVERWTEGDIKVIARQLLEGLKTMHDDGIAHRDIKPANIFPVLLDNQSLRIKIGDFGLSKRVSSDNATMLRTSVGTIRYTAPEILDPPDGVFSYTNAVDHWSLGCTLYRVVVGKEPFLNINQILSYRYNFIGFPRSDLQSAGLSEAGIKFIEGLLNPDPTRRLTTKDAFNTGWIASEPFGFQVTSGLWNRLRGSRPGRSS